MCYSEKRDPLFGFGRIFGQTAEYSASAGFRRIFGTPLVLYFCLFLLLVKFHVVYHKILMSVYMVVRSRPRRRELFFITVYCCTNVLFLPDTSCPRIRWILVTCVRYYTFGPRDLTKCLTYVVSVLRQI